ncbi:DEAD/DEAH box helicase [Microbacterium sp. 22215]|uniref:DEAD/DEAH box helicase n=1 Tax=Microbacterium sp. 22215 TaxID=3453893 RepID=UPI003F8388DC
MAVDITHRKLRNQANLEGSRFLELYERMSLGATLSGDEYQELLSYAIIFLRQGDATVEKLGYRIALQYSLDTADFDPLLDIADHRELMPVIAAIHKAHPGVLEDDSLHRVIGVAHSKNFTSDGITRTREQLALRAFNTMNAHAAIIAPTSYGKSEMMTDRALASLPGAVCIVVPSKALIAQTKAELVRLMRQRDISARVISHPEAYNGEPSFVAILTQERLHKLFVDNPGLKIDQLLIDEAQNVLSDDARALELSQVILVARARKADLQIAYYTPFLENPEVLRHVNGADEQVRARTVNEQVKIEQFLVGTPGESLHVFDQFLARSFETPRAIPADDADAVITFAGHRTIVYLNKPRDAQDLARRIAMKTAPANDAIASAAAKAIEAISDLIDKDYLLVDVIRSGVLFHHGQIPEVLRQYVESLFREDRSPDNRYLVTTSTLLEGVNTPADTMVLLSPDRGRGYLARSAFRNLVGRVARFSQIFSMDTPKLSLLVPKVYVFKSSYAPKRWNPLDWLEDRADPSKSASDSVENPLLESGPVDQPRIEALERLENIESGASGLEGARLAQTHLGRLCFRHGAHDFDVFRYELLMHERAADRTGDLVSTADDLIALIVDIFLTGVELGRNTDDLERIRDEQGARNFYAMFLSWRAEGDPLKLMIGRYLTHWNRQRDDLIWVGSKWGEVKRFETEHTSAYVRRSTKSRGALVNLAIVRIKAELDFLDYSLMKYLEILFSLELVEETFYLKLKYGTADRYVITLLRNGMSFELAHLVAESYREFVGADTAANTMELRPGLLEAIESANINDILLFEVRGLIGAQA